MPDLTRLLERSSVALFAIENLIGDAVIAFNDDGKILYANTKMRDLAGDLRNELEGSNVRALVVREGTVHDQPMAHLHARQASGAMDRLGRVELRRLDGQLVLVDVRRCHSIDPPIWYGLVTLADGDDEEDAEEPD